MELTNKAICNKRFQRSPTITGKCQILKSQRWKGEINLTVLARMFFCISRSCITCWFSSRSCNSLWFSDSNLDGYNTTASLIISFNSHFKSNPIWTFRVLNLCRNINSKGAPSIIIKQRIVRIVSLVNSQVCIIESFTIFIMILPIWRNVNSTSSLHAAYIAHQHMYLEGTYRQMKNGWNWVFLHSPFNFRWQG